MNQGELLLHDHPCDKKHIHEHDEYDDLYSRIGWTIRFGTCSVMRRFDAHETGSPYGDLAKLVRAES